MARTILIVGPVRSGKSRRLLDRYQEVMRSKGHFAAMLILPNAHLVEAARIKLIGNGQVPGLFNHRILTFPELAGHVLEAAERPAPQLSAVGERALVRLLVRRHRNSLAYFDKVVEFPGFEESLCDFIGELKRAGIEPEHFEAGLKRANLFNDKGKELALLYKGYQELLRKLDVYDVEGKFWLARDCLRDGRLNDFVWPSSVLVDGFENFTTTQLDMLEALAEKSDELVVALTHDRDDERGAVLGTTKRTFELLRKRFPHAQEVRTARTSSPDDDSPFMHLARNLFKVNPQKIDPGNRVKFLLAPGRRAEVMAIAREIKQLLIDGASPESIGVIFRSLDDYSDTIREIFPRFGIPLRMGHWISALACPVTRAVMLLVRIVQHDFRREDVVQFLKSSFVRFDATPTRANSASQAKEEPNGAKDADETSTPPRVFTPYDLDEIARRARIVKGREEWESRLNTLYMRWRDELEKAAGHTDEDDGYASSQVSKKSVDKAANALFYFKSFAAKIAELPHEGTHKEFVLALWNLIDFFKIPRHLASVLVPVASSMDVKAFAQLTEALDDIVYVGHLLEVAGGKPQKITLAEFARDLQTALANAVFQVEGCRQGRVNVLETHQARQMEFDHVFLGGVIEGEFPRARREDPFYRDMERRQMARFGLPLDERLPQQRDETMLFYGAACAARKSLHVSYLTSDSQGRPLLPSYYVEQLKKCLVEHPAEDNVSGPTTIRISLSDVTPEFDKVCHFAEAVERSFLNRLHFDPDFLRLLKDVRASGTKVPFLDPETMLGNALAGVHAERRRWESHTFDEYDGLLCDPHVLQYLGDRFGEHYMFSPSQLKDLVSCPFQFFAARVLNLSPIEVESEEADNLELGLAAHKLLRDMFSELKARFGNARITSMNKDQALKILDDVSKKYTAWRKKTGSLGDPDLWDVQCQGLLRSLEDFICMEAASNDQASDGLVFVPQEFEHSFGTGPCQALLLEDIHGKKFQVAGRIDRVDTCEQGENGPLFRVWDYKYKVSESVNVKKDSLDVQLAVYALAYEQNHPGYEPDTCGYLALRCTSKYDTKEKIKARNSRAARKLTEIAREELPRLVAQLRAGIFNVRALKQGCSFCKYKGICRYHATRLRHKHVACPIQDGRK